MESPPRTVTKNTYKPNVVDLRCQYIINLRAARSFPTAHPKIVYQGSRPKTLASGQMSNLPKKLGFFTRTATDIKKRLGSGHSDQICNSNGVTVTEALAIFLQCLSLSPHPLNRCKTGRLAPAPDHARVDENDVCWFLSKEMIISVLFTVYFQLYYLRVILLSELYIFSLKSIAIFAFSEGLCFNQNFILPLEMTFYSIHKLKY